MTVTVVLDGTGLHAWAQHRPPPQVLAVMEVVRRHGSGRVVVPSVVTVEALTGTVADARVERALSSIEVETDLPLSHARHAARLRAGLRVSAADAVVAESARRNRADFLITADPTDLRALLDRVGARAVIVIP